MYQCVVRTVIMYFLYQGLHVLVLVSEYGEHRIRFLVVVWSACLIVGPVGILVSLHSGPLVCRSLSLSGNKQNNLFGRLARGI